MKILKSLYGTFNKIFFAKFSSKIVLKVSRMKFVKKIRKLRRYFGKVLVEFLEKFEKIFLKFCEKFTKR